MGNKRLTKGSLALNDNKVIVINPVKAPAPAKLRVAAYARVSSDSTDQLNSFVAQTNYYLSLISSNENWKLVDIYADEGITGTSANKRGEFQRMLSDCRKAGLKPQIASSYRTHGDQIWLYNRKVNYYLGLGYSEDEAKKEAGTIIALPGTSEHELGLALDLVDESNRNLDESQEKTPVQQWLMKNSWRYGFILRYPNGKSAVTGIIYEPWHYRYVGKELAKELFESGLCLEEYLNSLS